MISSIFLNHTRHHIDVLLSSGIDISGSHIALSAHVVNDAFREIVIRYATSMRRIVIPPMQASSHTPQHHLLPDDTVLLSYHPLSSPRDSTPSRLHRRPSSRCNPPSHTSRNLPGPFISHKLLNIHRTSLIRNTSIFNFNPNPALTSI